MSFNSRNSLLLATFVTAFIAVTLNRTAIKGKHWRTLEFTALSSGIIN